MFRRAHVCAVRIPEIRPGLPLGDGRWINLAVDPIVVASLPGALAPFLPNRVGLLDARGNAATGLDANLLGSAVNGLSAVFPVVVLDRRAPAGIAGAAEPCPIKLA